MKNFRFKAALLMSIFLGIIYSCSQEDNNDEKNILLNEKVSNSNIASRISPTSKSDEAILEQLYSSESYQNMILGNWFTENETFDLKEYRITYDKNEEGTEVPVVRIIIRNDNGKVIGSLEAISFKNEQGSINFNILLRNYENLNLDNGNGTVSLIDINESYNYANAEIENHELVNVINLNNPSPNISYHTTSKRKPADLNHDGNVTFSECYMFMNQAIQSSDTSYSLCYFVGDAIGWVVSGWGPLCQYSVAASCVVIAATY